MKLKLIVLLTLPLLAANVARADDSDVKGTDYYMGRQAKVTMRPMLLAVC